MVVDFTKQFVNLEGEPVNNEFGKPIMLKDVCQTALLGQYQQEQVDGAEKARRWLLAVNIKSVVEVSVEEVALIKKLIGYAYGPLVVGQAYQMLESGN